jgi:hypothetical protein
MHLYNAFGKQTDKIKFSFEALTTCYKFRDAGLKFRKITKNSPLEAAKKLIEWFTNNQELIKSIGVK